MKEIEKKTFVKDGLTETIIIENVGIRSFDFLQMLIADGKISFDKQHDQIVILLGKGNNSADGLAMARQLHNNDFKVVVVTLLTNQKVSSECKKQMEFAKSLGILFAKIGNLDVLLKNPNNIIVDAVWGTGFSPPIPEKIARIFDLINNLPNLVIAIDIPSGSKLVADYTLTISAIKTVHLMGECAKCSGEVVVIDGGFDKKLFKKNNNFIIGKELVKGHLPKRDRWNHKNSYGHLLIIGGGPGMTGALSLSAMAAFKAGVGLVTAMTWDNSFSELTARVSSEIILSKISEADDFAFLNSYDAILIGPGLGNNKSSRDLVLRVLKNFKGPLVLDADAINVVNLDDDLKTISSRKYLTILTPHIGEFARLFELDKSKVKSNPLEYLSERAKLFKSAIVLKDAYTFVAFSSGEIFVNNVCNDALSTAGSGDILAGIISSILTQKKSLRESGIEYSAVAGVKIHSLMALLASKEMNPISISSSNLINYIGDAIYECEQ